MELEEINWHDYTMKPSQWERRKKAHLGRLAQWAKKSGESDELKNEYEKKIHEFIYRKGELSFCLDALCRWDRGHGQYLALKSESGWDLHLAKYLAYEWRNELWVAHRFFRIFCKGPSVKFSAQTAALLLAHMITLGWKDEAIAYGTDTYSRVEKQTYYFISDKFDEPGSRAGKFIFRLFADWQNITPNLPLDLADTEIYQNVLKVWRDIELDRLTPALLAALDEHVKQTRYTSSDSVWPCEFDISVYFAYPVEILMVLRLRQYLELPLPVLDHPLMVPPLGVLPEPTEPYTDDLLKAFEAKLRKDYPQMFIAPDPPPQEPPTPKPAMRPLPFVNIVEHLKSAFKR